MHIVYRALSVCVYRALATRCTEPLLQGALGPCYKVHWALTTRCNGLLLQGALGSCYKVHWALTAVHSVSRAFTTVYCVYSVSLSLLHRMHVGLLLHAQCM